MPGPRRTRSTCSSTSCPAQHQHHHGRRSAGQDRARYLRVRPVDRAAVRRQPRSGGRCHAAADRQVRQAGSRLRISRRGRQALDGGAGRLGLRAAAALRAHQPAQAVLRRRRAGLVSRRTNRHPDAAKDWTYDTQLKMAEAMFKAGYPDRLRLRLRTAPTPTRPGAPRSGRSAPTWSTPRARSPSTPTT